jgi:soluble cytochrome b562
MSDAVHADPADVRRLAKAMEQYQQRVNEASKQARQAINHANWKDKQKQQFESRFRDFQHKTDSFVGAEVKDFVKKLNALASDLDRARSHRF